MGAIFLIFANSLKSRHFAANKKLIPAKYRNLKFYNIGHKQPRFKIPEISIYRPTPMVASDLYSTYNFALQLFISFYVEIG